MGCGGSKAVAAVQPLTDEVLEVTKFDQHKENGHTPGENGTVENGSADGSGRVPASGQSADQPDSSSTVVKPESPAVPLVQAPAELQPVKLQANGSSAVAFEIPLEPGESLIQRHPPKRFTRLEDNQLTLETFQGKHAGAAERRNQLLNKRVQSARVRNLRSAGRAKSRTTMRSDDEPVRDAEKIEGGVEDREQSSEMVA
ncbi:hypothetical protein FJT64_008015 [Amphibalanus amphitrite]|uniref:Uncharacterized protein n=1 Tax=Amphibalanus amphitrite TaxID=1232801 RepID=A0A6A4VJU5_AMPAM|nr:hypothetical protein FJT64_008015 [Amphibalanus amphitrite]